MQKTGGTFPKINWRSKKLWEKQEILKPPQHQLIEKCTTQWGRILGMLQRILEQLAAIAAVQMEANMRHLMPDWDDWVVQYCSDELNTWVQVSHPTCNIRRECHAQVCAWAQVNNALPMCESKRVSIKLNNAQEHSQMNELVLANEHVSTC